MLVTIDLPDEIATELQTHKSDIPRDMLEAYALQSHRSGRLTDLQVGKLLGLESAAALARFLKRGVAATQEDLAPESPAPANGANRYPLQGTPYFYEDPFGPAAPLEDWDALK